MMTVVLVERQGAVVGERKHKECCVVSEGGWQERHGGIIGYQKVLGVKERSWTRTTCLSARRAARKHKGLHHMILGRTKRGGSRTQRFAPCNSVFLEVPPLLVLLEYCLGML